MTKQRILALERRVAGLKRRYAAGVALIVPSESGYDLIYSAYNGERREAHFASIEAAEREYSRFSREYPAARGESPALVVVDV